MLNLAGYQETELLYTGTRTLVYRALHLASGRPVIIKVLRNPHPHFNELIQFRNQYVTTRHFEHPHVVQPLSLDRHGNGYALVMPDQGAVSLADYWQTAEHRLSEVLKIALQLAEALHTLAKQHIIHKDIKPANILIHPNTGQIQLIDFSIASLLPKEQWQLVNPKKLEGTLAYIAPEQTGRMNRGIDYRADFYSLGVTLYELLTGMLPFSLSDPLELVHCHISQAPIAPVDLLDAQGHPYPAPLSAIIMKLMAKNAEDRYQTALGLKHDLERCLQSLESAGKITNFELGERDICDRFNIPEKLYGREAEVQALLNAFDRVASPPKTYPIPNSELLLIAGFSGIGKTAVVNEVHKPIVRQQGYFIKGKFDQFNRNIPLSAFVQAFRDLMGQLLSESDAALANWQTKILAAVGENGQVLIDVIPELERVIGMQPDVPELSGTAARNRFNLLFQNFIAVFTTPEHPLVIFLDDLQWADSASLSLMQILMGESETGYLLLLGAYRDNEVSSAHPLMLSLQALKERTSREQWEPDELSASKEPAPGTRQAKISTLTLAPLPIAEINQLVAETLSCPPQLAHPLTELVYPKTQGNPFFTTQFLKGLYQDKLIIFNHDLGYWQCDLVQVRDAALTDDVVEFMAGRLLKLPTETQNVLKLAACIGNQFDLETLAVICETVAEKVAANLWEALREGLILPITEAYKFFQAGDRQEHHSNEALVNYRFLHDRVQQAAYTLISETQKQVTHLKVGQLLLNHAATEELENSIFMIVNQLNMAIALIQSDAEHLHLARLNLRAGKKAKLATAYGAASTYLAQSMALLPPEHWQSHYELTLDCYSNAIEAEYLNTQFAQANALSEVVLTHAQTTLDRVRIYELKIQMHVACLEMIAAMELGLDVLKMLEVQFVETPPDCTDVEALVALPQLTDAHHLAVMRILMSLISSAYFADPSLLPKIIFTTIARSRLYGNSAYSAYGYVLYGLLLCGPFQDIELGYRYGQLALKLLEKFDAQDIKPRILLVFNGNIRHWKEHTQTTLHPLQSAIQIGLEIGDIEYAGYASTNCSDQTVAVGTPLDEVAQIRQTYLSLMSGFSQDYSINHHRIGLQFAQNLLGQAALPTSLIGSAFNETQMLPIFLESRNAALLFNLYFAKGRLCYFLKDSLAALENLNLAAQYIESVAGMITVGEHCFYHSLAILAALPEDLVAQAQAIEQVKVNQEKMQSWSTHAPENYQHKYDLITAELHRVLGQKLAAMDYYDQAIAHAKQNNYSHEEALANELAAEFYLTWEHNALQSQDKTKIAVVYLQDAYYGYARWGAKAKTDDLEQRYAHFLTAILRQPIFSLQSNALQSSTSITPTWTETKTNTNVGVNQQLDFASLMKATRTISQEIELDSAIASFMKILQENAGAQTVVLLLLNEQELTVAAQLINGQIQAITETAAQLSQAIPLSIINAVQNTQQPIVLDNGSDAPNYARDSYIQTHQPQSILCLPLVNRSQSIGLLYLENNQCQGAFTQDRVEVLTLLCAQAAITLENARLYHQAKQALKLEQEIHELQRTQLHLIQSEKMYGLGQLVAGIAHEINNPINFIHGNVKHANEYMQDLLNLVDLYQNYYPEPHAVVREAIAAIDLPFLKTDFQDLLQSMQTGSDRIETIIASLRTFSRLDEAEFKAVDLHTGLESTLTILQNRLQEQDHTIQVIKDYGDLPLYACYAGQLNQVFMGILSNAIDALRDKQNHTHSTISITTRAEAHNIVLTIADNGIGMDDKTHHHIFDPFFTTKDVGKGTGLGMAIAHQIITDKHGGSITCTSELDQGTIFTITLPLTSE